jgi:tripartite-type tricarboxylate transporter receptor subunit TctC
MEAFITTPDAFAKFVTADYAKYGALVKTVGAKID